ncbi:MULTISPECIES: hypothetical protein [Gluconobacter]|uniref:Uncharacterized protein n=1 Tax=Gluconobacter albidus TaxID=318683 RepID=A0A149TMV7_9PROT|nr:MULTISPECIES: hypothetical protein [Gluconobacter]KXV50606.1 hypothetical protein AD945_01560 [Gluconobacter albidus]
MGSVVPPVNNNNTDFGKVTAWEKLKTLKDTLVDLKEYSRKLASSFIITPTDLEELEVMFSACQSLAQSLAGYSFEETETEQLRQDCLNCFALLKVGFAPCGDFEAVFSG